jgi:paraquat-inducible protein B
VVSLGFEDPDVLLHYEKLKVQDLQKELDTKLNELDSVKAQLASKADLEAAVSETKQSAAKAQAAVERVERQMDEAVESKAQLASKCAMEIMRLTMILNTLQRHPKIKHIVDLLLDESAQKTNNKGGLLG